MGRFAASCAALVLLLFGAGGATAAVTGSIVSFGVTNYTGYLIASDTNAGGRQAIRTSTSMFYTNASSTSETYDFALEYKLVDSNDVPVPILDETGKSNFVYTVYQTNTLPYSYLLIDPLRFITVTSLSLTNTAGLQPLVRLDPYNEYTAVLQLYSRTNGVGSYSVAAVASDGPYTYDDFTNTVSPDPSPNLIVTMAADLGSNTFCISTSPGEGGYPVQVAVVVARYDDFTQPPHPTNTTVRMDFQLVNAASGVPVPIVATQAVLNFTIESTEGSPPSPVVKFAVTNVSLIPRAPLDSVDDKYYVVITQSHTEGAALIIDHTNYTGPQQFLYFNRTLNFGSVRTFFTNITGPPVITNTVPGSHLDCLIAISTNAGWIEGAPGHTYGNSSNIAVSLATDGTATFIGSAAVKVQAPAVDTGTIANISFQRAGMTLSASGAGVGTLIVDYPAGFSTGFPTNGLRWTVGGFTLANVALDQSLNPENGTLTYPFAVYGVQENLPVWFSVPAIQWVVNSGQLLMSPTAAIFARQLEDDLLTANEALLANTNFARRVSNDAYFRNVNVSAGSMLVVTADANGVAQLSAQLSLDPPELRPHFPYSGNADGQEIPTASGGMLIISNGVIGTNSFLPVSQPVPLTYMRDCSDTDCSSALSGPATLQFIPNEGHLEFNTDGGLVAYGMVPTTDLTWGYVSGGNYAQKALSVQECGYEMAGIFLPAVQTTLEDAQLPAMLLFSGFGDGTNTTYTERPGDTNYDSGLANYAGLNFRAPATGESYLADQSTGAYRLTTRSKYYARFAGVSGIHEAASFPSSLALYGYDFTFTTYRLSFLDSSVEESRTDGAISFPAQPSGFIQRFQDMIFSCRGDLESAAVPPNSGVEHLNYWDVDFTPQSIQFQPSVTDPCGTSKRWLVLGVQTQLPFIPQKLEASLGFQPNGNLVTAADGVAKTDSRFRIPAQLSLQGPGGDIYPLSTCSDGYFNNWATAGAPPNGFYNIAGRSRVPFFEDVKVHLHVMPTGSNTAQISIMGGWPYAGSTAQDLGWSVNTSNYFNYAVFDPNADGFPAGQGVSINNYENSSTTMYHARAQRDWIEVAVFDYPLQWNPALREFTGFQDAPVQLPIINVNSRLKEISPGIVDFDFDQDVSLQLPAIKSLDFLNDAVNEITGPLTSVSNAVRSAINTAFTTTGFNELQQTLREDPTTFFQPVLANAFAPVVDQLYNQLLAYPETDKEGFLSNAVFQVNNAGLTAALIPLNGTAGQANTVIGQVNNTLNDAQNDLGVLLKILAKNSGGDRDVVGAIMQQLVSDQGPVLGFVASLGGSELDSLVSGLDPTLDDIQSQLGDLSNQVAQAQTSLNSASGDFHQALGQALTDATGASQFVSAAANNLSNRLAGLITPAGDYFSSNPAGAKAAIQTELMNAFLSSQIPTDYQQTLKQFLFDDNATLDTLMDTLFDQINDAIRDGLSDLITDNSDSTFQAVKGLASGSFLTAKIRGTPTFNGDSMRKIHLDATVQLSVPTSMNFDAYMEILELDSQNVPVDCIPAGPPAAEVTIGANNVTLDWAAINPEGVPLTLSVAAKWTLQNGNVIGLGGQFDIKGEIGFQGCSVNEIGAALAFGEEENYFAAKVAGTVNILGVPVDVQAGVFVGKACSLQPILFIDPEATNVLSLPPNEFAGIYLEFGAGLSLSQIIFGTSSCFLDLGVDLSYAVYYDQTSSIEQLGTRQTMGIDASLLCLLSASASLTMFGTAEHSPSGFGLEVGGDAQFCGSIGPCPFCISGCKGISITGQVNSGGISYSVNL
jgi:hypothetical protein